MPQDDQPKSTTKEVVSEFCSATTAHGPSHVASETNRVMKLIWLVIFILALMGLGVHLSVTVRKYLSRPTQEMTFISQNPPTFPAVTLCNHNPVSEISLQKFYLQKPDSNTSWFKEQVDLALPYITTTVTSSLGHLDDFFGSSVSYYENIGREEANSISHSWKDFILDCTYAGFECTENDFSLIVHPLYYNCYVFHGHEVLKQNPTVGRGSFNGLSLVLYLGPGYSSLLNFYNRFSPISNGIGARVELHEADDIPLPDVAGVDIMPGASTSLSLRSEIIIKEPPPFGNCTSRIIPSTSLHPNLTYTSALCYSLCQQDYVFKSCGCYVPSLPSPGEPTCGTFHLPHTTVQDKLDAYVVNLECLRSTEQSFDNAPDGRAACDCPPECETTLYFSSMSESRWPGPAFHQDFLNEYLNERPDKETLQAYQLLSNYLTGTPNSAELRDIIETQFARLNIYFNDLDVIVRKTIPSYELPQLFCDIGGTLGLWAGVSIITVVELVALGGKLLSTVFNCSKRDKSVKRVDVQTKGSETMR